MLPKREVKYWFYKVVDGSYVNTCISVLPGICPSTVVPRSVTTAGFWILIPRPAAKRSVMSSSELREGK